MDQISYGGEWYREPLGTYTTGPPYIREWNRSVMVSFLSFLLISQTQTFKLSLYLCDKLIHLFSSVSCFLFAEAIPDFLQPECSSRPEAGEDSPGF